MAQNSNITGESENPNEDQLIGNAEKPELSTQDVSEMLDWYKYFDKNGDGKLDNKEMTKVFAALGWNLTDAEQKEIFTIHDKDNSGFIEQKEYELMLRSLQKDRNTEKLELIEAFRKFDPERSGTISQKDLCKFMQSKDMVTTSNDTAALKSLMKKATPDEDGDGDVNIEEFVNLLLEVPSIELLKAQQMDSN